MAHPGSSRGSESAPVMLPEMVEIPRGSFVMGATADDKFANATERPAHPVEFAYRFALGRGPVTVGEWRCFAPEHAPGEDPLLPVVNVSWHEARNFCAWLRTCSGQSFRLPTEAEWEYACRAGERGVFHTGPVLNARDANFLFDEGGERVRPGKRTVCGAYEPNAWGLYDMHGNACEWIEDCWHPAYHGAPADGSAWCHGGDQTRRVIRGGAWDYLPRLLRSAWRDALPPGTRRDNLGFRLALTLEDK